MATDAEREEVRRYLDRFGMDREKWADPALEMAAVLQCSLGFAVGALRSASCAYSSELGCIVVAGSLRSFPQHSRAVVEPRLR
jgi:hypothetical protein